MVASDAATSRQLRLRLASGTSWVSHLLQDMVEVTLGRPEVAKQMTQARKDYAQRRKALESALLEQGVPCAADGDGLNLWVPLDTDDQAVALALAHRGWLVRHGDAFGVQDPVRGLRITISRSNPASAASWRGISGKACSSHGRGQRRSAMACPNLTARPVFQPGWKRQALPGISTTTVDPNWKCPISAPCGKRKGARLP